MAKKNRRTLWRSGGRSWPSALVSLVNYLFSGNGTLILLMVFWLALTMGLVAYPLSFPNNVEPVNKETTSKEQVENQWNLEKAVGLAFGYAVPLYRGAPDIARARLVGPTCSGQSTAVPNQNSSGTKSDVKPMEEQTMRDERIRVVIELKRFEIPLVVLNSPYIHTQLETFQINAPEASQKTDKASVPTCEPETKLWPWSPHDFAQVVSYVQLILWLFLAGNLPTVMRRRG